MRVKNKTRRQGVRRRIRRRHQSGHTFASIYGRVKPEAAKLNRGYNHFAVKSHIYLASLKRAMELLSAFNLEDKGLLA
jgi:hypothetical protein